MNFPRDVQIQLTQESAIAKIENEQGFHDSDSKQGFEQLHNVIGLSRTTVTIENSWKEMKNYLKNYPSFELVDEEDIKEYAEYLEK